MQAPLFAMAAPIWFPSAPVVFLFSNECNGSMLSGTALVFAGLVQRAFLDEVVAHSGFRQNHNKSPHVSNNCVTILGVTATVGSRLVHRHSVFVS